MKEKITGLVYPAVRSPRRTAERTDGEDDSLRPLPLSLSLPRLRNGLVPVNPSSFDDDDDGDTALSNHDASGHGILKHIFPAPQERQPREEQLRAGQKLFLFLAQLLVHDSDPGGAAAAVGAVGSHSAAAVFAQQDQQNDPMPEPGATLGRQGFAGEPNAKR